MKNNRRREKAILKNYLLSVTNRSGLLSLALDICWMFTNSGAVSNRTLRITYRACEWAWVHFVVSALYDCNPFNPERTIENQLTYTTSFCSRILNRTFGLPSTMKKSEIRTMLKYEPWVMWCHIIIMSPFVLIFQCSTEFWVSFHWLSNVVLISSGQHWFFSSSCSHLS